MSEQNGKVIDGTARASHWRRSSPSSTSDADAIPGHSEAPKDIASSLLVPAHMLLDGAASTISSSAVDEAVGDRPGEHPSGLVPTGPVTAEDHHVNIFLAAEHASEVATRPTEAGVRRRVRAVVRRATGRTHAGLRRGHGDRRRWSIALRGRYHTRTIAIGAATLGVVTVLATGAVVIGQSGSPPSHQGQASLGHSGSFLESLSAGVLAATADPFSTTTVVHRSVARDRPVRHATRQRPRSHSAATPSSTRVRRTSGHRVVMAHYSPPADGGATSNTQHTTGTASNSPPAAPARSTGTSNSSSSSGSRSSSGSGSPSKAALKSLVTGAGTCSCQ